MFPKKITALIAAAALLSAAAIHAQESAILLNLLVKKGIITEAEASEVLAEIQSDATAEPGSMATPASVVEFVPPPKPDIPQLVAGKKSSLLNRLTFSNRIQAQYAHITTDVSQTDLDPAHINHFFLRRIYFGVSADLGEGWKSNLTYDFATSSFDRATIEWKHSDALGVQVGLRKAPIAYEEFQTSSGSLKAIERSAATRYFVEPNNGRRLGGGGYRQGVYLHGDQGKLTYMAAVTNPERQQTAGQVAGVGDDTNNSFGYWGFLGYGDLYEGGSFQTGISLGYLPDQGGKELGAGDDLVVAGIFGDIKFDKLSLTGEVFLGKNDNGAGENQDASPWGFWIQPSYTMGIYELVFRYSHVNSDGRGISLSDGLRSSASGGTMNKMDEFFFGGNWYIRGNTLKLQAGYIYGRTKDNLDGTPAEATAQGLRSQLQVSF